LHTAVLALLLFCMTAIAGEGGETRDPREFFFAQSFGDLPDELEDARKSGKTGLLLYFEQDGCPYCRRLMQTVFNQRNVQDWYGENFVSIAVDIRGDVELRDVDGITLPSKVFAEHRKIKLTPVISFLDLNGTEIFRKSGMVANPYEFLLMGRYITEGRYTDTVFADFLAEKGYTTSGEILHTPATDN
jgi:thioredoxin-related protein